MLRNYSTSRNFSQNLQLGALTAFSAGMANVISVIIFFAFTSNVTGHYAVLAQEIAQGNWYQASIVVIWISLFLIGSFTSNFSVINANNGKYGRYLAHSIPLILEICCFLFVGIYLQYYYNNNLKETEILVAVMLFAMGLQNGLTASISNGVVKTTHLTGLTTDLGILFSMLTKKQNRKDKAVVQKTQLLLVIMLSYMAGGIFSGVIYYNYQTLVLYAVCVMLLVVVAYDFVSMRMSKMIIKKKVATHKKSLREQIKNQTKNISLKNKSSFETANN